ncbi:hypothetical protein EJ04DRAFT_550982 [Polyplosphaeria fusca]|uniref:Uncharacterized protein n=1 Tax=Polyplosphaeria fusca TaxID=682080 RepID=A0A9P4R4J0_9PLEO|nr:hypothetical protein EJ04DRAFT_550982 [Polyplosphaeria fusca]
MAALEELGSHLQSLLVLKPPGITKTKIEAISQLCFQNVQSDAAIVQKIVQQFRNSPATHKLGVIYVVDTVARQWMENARKSGQAVSKSAAPGTFASGVQQVTDVLPGMMSDLILSAPETQKEKISKLLDIWERGQTFPLGLIAGFKQQLAKQKNTYTPPGSPPKGPTAHGGQANPPAVAQPSSAQDNASLLAALTNFGQQNIQNPAQTNPNPVPTAPPAFPFQPGVAPPLPGFVPPPPVPFAGSTLPPPPPTGGNEMMQQIVQALASGMIPQEQAIPLLAALAQQQAGGASMLPAPHQPAMPPSLPTNGQVQTAPNSTQPDRFEQNGVRYRDRSRSPDYGGRRRFSQDRRSPPNRRDSPTYGAYDPNANVDGNNANRHQDRERGRGRGRNRGRNEYRQRTPPAQRRQPSPGPQASRGGQPKFLEWDHNLPRDNIKVLSRTLFVGGAGGTEGEIRTIFGRFGHVQTCIVNQDKRHAFVKMVNRRDAVAAKEGMDVMTDASTLAKARQTRWGVGFGPRDCSDYNTGVSVIPISRLTDADRKWVVTAEYGGTGGRALEGGMVLEEPDIEIGAGVSSKAISRRVPQAESGRRGGGHGGRGGHDHGPRSRRNDRAPVQESRRISPRPEPNVAVPPAVPGFGFQLPGF